MAQIHHTRVVHKVEVFLHQWEDTRNDTGYYLINCLNLITMRNRQNDLGNYFAKKIKNVDQFLYIGYALTHSESCSSWLCFPKQQNHILHDNDV